MTSPRFAKIPAAAILDPAVTPKDLRVLCLLARHTNKHGWCRRSQVTMSEDLAFARSTVQLSIERLVLAGWLVKQAHCELHTRGVRDSAYQYQVLMSPTKVPLSEGAAAGQKSAPPADPCVGTYVLAADHGGCQPGANRTDSLTKRPSSCYSRRGHMADHFYCCDWIRCNTFPDVFGSIRITGWSGVAACCDVCLVGPAL